MTSWEIPTYRDGSGVSGHLQSKSVRADTQTFYLLVAMEKLMKLMLNPENRGLGAEVFIYRAQRRLLNGITGER